jgi:hypothetical protein
MAEQKLPFDHSDAITTSDDTNPPTKDGSGNEITYTDSERRSVVRK